MFRHVREFIFVAGRSTLPSSNAAEEIRK